MRSLLILISSVFIMNPALSVEDRTEALLESLRAKKFVLSIGINKFDDELWHDLKFAGKDAKDIYESFTLDGKSFDGGDLITGEQLGRDVTKIDIEKSFARLSQVNRNEDDTVVVYLSTHGTVAYKKDGSLGRYIITSNSDSQNLAETSIDYQELISMFRSLKSRRKVLILAFCHSGVGKSVLTPEMKRALAELKSPYFEQPMHERAEGSIILTASGWREPALESQKLQNDVYTHFLIKGLNQDMNGDGAVSITEAHDYASRLTYEFTQGRQRPSAILELLGTDPVIVKGSPKKQGKATLFSLMGRFADLMVSVDGKYLGTLKKGVNVPEGKVRLQVKDPSSNKMVADRVVSFEAGQEYSVANFLIPRLPHNLQLGLKGFSYLKRDFRKEFAPQDVKGIMLDYRYEEAFGIFDLGLSLTYYPEVEEGFRTDVREGLQGFGAVESIFEGQKYIYGNQKRSMGTLDMLIGVRDRIPMLSLTDNSVKTEWLGQIGPSVLLTRRHVLDDYYIDRNSTNVAPGLSGRFGMIMTLPYHLVRLGLSAELSAYRNYSSFDGNLLSAGSVSFHLGTFW